MSAPTVVLSLAISFIPTTGQPQNVTGQVQREHVRVCQYSTQAGYCVVNFTVPGPVVRADRPVRTGRRHYTK
jgi:hypothetical protein